MDVLRAQLARSWPEDGMHVEDDAAHRLVATTCSALGSLVARAAGHLPQVGQCKAAATAGVWWLGLAVTVVWLFGSVFWTEISDVWPK